jgi:tartrate/fumarate subfamily iron-sulfur-dependent hydro-lyase beta chain
MLTGRDAAHKRIQDMLAKGEELPVDFKNRVIYYVGPVDPVRDEVVGPAGPTTATRMDKFTDMMLEKTGLIAMIGKAERGPAAIESIKKHKSAYLMAVGGAAYLVSKAIKQRRCWALPTWAWKRSTSSTWSTCRSPWPWIRKAPRCTTPVLRNGRPASSSSTYLS